MAIATDVATALLPFIKSSHRIITSNCFERSATHTTLIPHSGALDL
jgi:hypothetical protein